MQNIDQYTFCNHNTFRTFDVNKSSGAKAGSHFGMFGSIKTRKEGEYPNDHQMKENLFKLNPRDLSIKEAGMSEESKHREIISNSGGFFPIDDMGSRLNLNSYSGI